MGTTVWQPAPQGEPRQQLTKAYALVQQAKKMIAACYDLQALIYEKQGRYREAEEYDGKASSIYENLLGENHPETTNVYLALA